MAPRKSRRRTIPICESDFTRKIKPLTKFTGINSFKNGGNTILDLEVQPTTTVAELCGMVVEKAYQQCLALDPHFPRCRLTRWPHGQPWPRLRHDGQWLLRQPTLAHYGVQRFSTLDLEYGWWPEFKGKDEEEEGEEKDEHEDEEEESKGEEASDNKDER